MQALRQMSGGVIIAIISLLLVIGGIYLSLAETTSTQQPTPTPLPTNTAFAVEFASPIPSPTTFAPTVTPIDTSTSTPFPSATLAQATSCPIPNGWFAITVGVNDTLHSIAQRYNTTVENLNTANCLNFINPTPGAILYVPPGPTAVVVQCRPPAGWVRNHVVQPGENLFRIALSYGITYPQLQAGNCMGTSTTIFVGQILWVPNVPTRTPTVLPTSTTNYSTPTWTASPTQIPSATSTFIITSSPVPTNTTIPSPTSTFIQTVTLTPFPTQNTSP